MKPYQATINHNGIDYAFNVLMTPEQFEHFERIGLFDDIGEIVGMDDVADQIVAKAHADYVIERARA